MEKVNQIFSKKLFTAGGVLKDQLITVTDGKIARMENGVPAENIRCVENLCAGFVDLQINGGQKFYFTQHPTVETIADIDHSFNALGTYYKLPTLVTSSLENILKGIEAIKIYKESNPSSGVLGMHLEGPFLNPVKRGAHLLKYIRKPSNSELKEIIHHGKDVIKLMTIAPEVFEPGQIQMLVDAGIVVAAGHSNATYGEACIGFNSGINLVTHMYNAMSPFEHRRPGIVGAVFDSDQVFSPVILDGLHCDFAAARIAYKIKKDKFFLISDALFIGDEVIDFEWGQFNAKLINGQYINSSGNLAGSSISLGDAVRNAVQKVGIPLHEAIEMVTYRPAKAIHLDAVIGKIETGYPAIFTVFDNALLKFETLTL